MTETGMLGRNPNDTPIETRKKPEDNKQPVDRERYQGLVRKLIYLSHTRPNIAFVVSVVNQHMHSPTDMHLDAIYRILKYLGLQENDYS